MNFSVIIPTYNRSNYLALAIVSALRQKKVTMEIIVSDDCSTDNTENVVKSFKDKRIRYIRNTVRLGPAMNYRQCFLTSHGDNIFTLGDDDFLLDDRTFADILLLMNHYGLGMVKIGAFGYEHSLTDPYQIISPGSKALILKPGNTPNILTQVIDFGLGYFSGMTFNNLLLDKRMFRLDHRCYSEHMCPIERPAAFDLIKRYGIGYLPNHFVVGHLSTQLIPRYFSLKKSGWLFMEKPIEIAKRFMTPDEHELFKKAYLRRHLVLLPNIKVYTDYENYLTVIKRMISIDYSLIGDPNFIFFILIGFMPNVLIKFIRILSIYLSRTAVYTTAKNCGYSKSVQILLNDRRLRKFRTFFNSSSGN